MGGVVYNTAMISHNQFLTFIKTASTASKLFTQFFGKGLSRNGAMRKTVKSLLSKGDFTAAARIEGQRTAEQIARLASKGKVPHVPVRNDGLYEVWKHPAAKARQAALSNAQSFAHAQHSTAMGSVPTIATDYRVQNMPAAYKKLYGVSDTLGAAPKEIGTAFQNFENGAIGGMNFTGKTPFGTVPLNQPYASQLPTYNFPLM